MQHKSTKKNSVGRKPRDIVRFRDWERRMEEERYGGEGFYWKCEFW